MLRNADVAMYAAKEQEKGHFEVFDDRQAAPLLRRDTLTGELERAVEELEGIVRRELAAAGTMFGP